MSSRQCCAAVSGFNAPNRPPYLHTHKLNTHTHTYIHTQQTHTRSTHKHSTRHSTNTNSTHTPMHPPPSLQGAARLFWWHHNRGGVFLGGGLCYKLKWNKSSAARLWRMQRWGGEWVEERGGGGGVWPRVAVRFMNGGSEGRIEVKARRISTIHDIFLSTFFKIYVFLWCFFIFYISFLNFCTSVTQTLGLIDVVSLPLLVLSLIGGWKWREWLSLWQGGRGTSFGFVSYILYRVFQLYSH